MSAKSRSERRPAERHASERPRATPGLLEQRSLEIDPAARLPTVRLRSVRLHSFLFRKLIGEVDSTARAGDLVSVLTPQGEQLGYGLYNPKAEIVVRMLQFGGAPPDAAFWDERLQRAVDLRRNLLQLDETTDAYRLIHAEADGFPGFVVDRYGDVLSAEVFSLAMYQRSQAILGRLAALLQSPSTTHLHTLIQTAPQTHGQEGFLAEPIRSPALPREVTISEFGTRFRVRFEEGHKTGFFCDQRDNRRRLAGFSAGKSVLDLCCYTGGFAIQAARLGGASEVTGVDLDEDAIALARDNARLNQAKVTFVHADVFGYMRDMLANGRQYDVVVLDPPKLIRNRRELEEGTRKHFDLNRLAIQLVASGGVLLTCSCSGLLAESEFLRLLHKAARVRTGPTHRADRAGSPPGRIENSSHPAAGRTLQVLARTGAGPDHPVSPDCPETEYLKAVWLRVT